MARHAENGVRRPGARLITAAVEGSTDGCTSPSPMRFSVRAARPPDMAGTFFAQKFGDNPRLGG